MSRTQHRAYSLLLKAKARPEGYTKILGRGEMGLKHLEFGLLSLSSGEWSGRTGKCECGLDIHSGILSLEIGSPAGDRRHERLGSRKNAFDGLPTSAYLPPGSSYRISVVEGPVEIAVFSAAAHEFKAEPAVVHPEETLKTSIGKGNWSSDSYICIGDNVPAANLLIGETVIPPGNWSGLAPHKHDAFIPPSELVLEEIQYFQTNRDQAYGIIRLYTQPNDPAPMNEVYVVENGDTIVIPRGYHLAAAAPGYTLHYTWALAGEIRKYGAWTFDPRHASLSARI
ncbi:MAG TPA: 5-deoxy-glucuronate isomerase [Armatimonadota bacterium]|nr:5-deoxy-glucuronate isomerase [Armatimonadota bacterium]